MVCGPHVAPRAGGDESGGTVTPTVACACSRAGRDESVRRSTNCNHRWSLPSPAVPHRRAPTLRAPVTRRALRGRRLACLAAFSAPSAGGPQPPRGDAGCVRADFVRTLVSSLEPNGCCRSRSAGCAAG